MNTNRRRTAALIAGISLIVMAVTAILGNGIVHPMVIVPGDGIATREAISAHPLLFALDIGLWGVIFVTDVLVAWALYRFFAGRAKRAAMAVFLTRLVYSFILAAGIVNLALAAGSATPLVQVGRFDQYWSGGLILFGLHLVFLGMAARQSGDVPKVFVWLLLVAGPAYTAIHALPLVGSGAAEVASILQLVFMLPMTAAEVGFAIWLVVRGDRPRVRRAGRREQGGMVTTAPQRRAAAS